MTTYHSILQPHVERELDASRGARGRRDPVAAWHHLERAHVLSQPSARLHTRVHWAMLVAATTDVNLMEMLGQLVRILVAGIGSVVGRYPVGNTGRARVPIALPMPIASDLARILDEVEVTRRASPRSNI